MLGAYQFGEESDLGSQKACSGVRASNVDLQDEVRGESSQNLGMKGRLSGDLLPALARCIMKVRKPPLWLR